MTNRSTDEEVARALRDAETDTELDMELYDLRKTLAHAADLLESTLARNAEMEAEIAAYKKSYADVVEVRDRYAASARAIHVWLEAFCDGTFPYPEMVAEAARLASEQLTETQRQLREAVEDLRKANFCSQCRLHKVGRCNGLNKRGKCADWEWRGQDAVEGE